MSVQTILLTFLSHKT